MFEETIKTFSKQFSWKPEVVNANKLKPASNFVVGGMGGSSLATGLLKILRPGLDIYIHRNYGLPADCGPTQETLYVASSYSGNTEEVLDFAQKSLEKDLNLAVISTGGRLLRLAKEKNLPYVELPKMVSHPRFGLALSLKALARLIGDTDLETELSTLREKINPRAGEKDGKVLAKRLVGRIPIIYSATPNKPLAYNWKIRFNETSKVPAFCNVFPELNHNEIAGLDNEELSQGFYFIFLEDPDDHPKIKKRMDVLEKILKDRDLPVARIKLKGKTAIEKIFNSILLADWTTFYLADSYGVDPEKIEIIEQFKKQITH